MIKPSDPLHNLRRRAEERLIRQPAEPEPKTADAVRLLHELQVHQVELEMQNEELRQTEAALRESEAKYRLLSDAAGECILWIDPDNQVRYASPACQEVLGHSPDAFMASPDLLLSLIHEDDLPEYFDHFKPHSEFRILRNGHERWIVHRRKALYDEAGNLIGLRISGHDITERKQAEQEIAALNRALERELADREAAEEALREANGRKDEFLAMLAHELRNPLVPIGNAAHVLGGPGMDEAVVEWAKETIEGQVAHLTRLVDDLLDVSRIAHGKITLKREAKEFADLARQAVDTVRPLLESMGHRFTVRLPPEPVRVEADPVRLTQVLLNLLDNAAKYTPEGGRVELEARVEGGELAIRISDNGVGIPEKLLPHVFDLFQQGERSFDRSQGGLGIGLTLVQRLVELHGGRVEAHSEGVGKGSTFTVRLPLLQVSRPAPAGPVHGKSRPAAGTRVLVVDDDPAVAGSLEVLLEMEGYDVRVAASGPDALELVPVFGPCVVVLDIGLQGMDGFETARRLRQLPAGRKLAIMAMTGYGDDETRIAALQAGCDHHLVKPMNAKQFLGLLAEVAHSVGAADGGASGKGK